MTAERPHGDRAILAVSRWSMLGTGATVAAALGFAWLVSFSAGGSRTVWPHLFYIPVVIAAFRFGHRAVLAVAVIAGLAAGPVMPLDVSESTSQAASNWLPRLGMFVLIGQLITGLRIRSLPIAAHRIASQRARRALQGALDRGEIRPAYQPIVELHTGRIMGVEALARWHHPTRGTISPAEFIPLAERSDLIRDLDRQILTQACRQVAEWRHTLLAERGEFKLGVNLSGRDFDGPGIAADVAETLQETQLPPHWLHLEVTETVIAEEVDHAAEGMAALKLLGMRLAIDDFGVGQSSLAALHRFPVDVIKIDKSFVDMLGGEARADSLMSGVIRLALELGVWSVVIEGIERAEQRERIANLGRVFAQGYLFSPPVDPARAAELISVGHLAGDTDVVPVPHHR